MTTEDRDLLMKDLCGRLPYKVRCKCVNGLGGGKTDRGVLKYIGNCNGVISNYYEDIPIDSGFVNNVFYPIENVKPYLRPMLTMSEEELNECVCQSGIKDIECPNWQDIPKEKQFEARLNHAIAVFLTDSNNVDWLNARHFDYRGLIPMGLAIEAPEGMYEIK